MVHIRGQISIEECVEELLSLIESLYLENQLEFIFVSASFSKLSIQFFDILVLFFIILFIHRSCSSKSHQYRISDHFFAHIVVKMKQVVWFLELIFYYTVIDDCCCFGTKSVLKVIIWVLPQILVFLQMLLKLNSLYYCFLVE